MKHQQPTTSLEQTLFQQGFQYVVGVDEAGRGPLAGPVSAGAVLVSPSSETVCDVHDSKYMTSLQRDCAYEKIVQNKTICWGVSMVGNTSIDRIGINKAVYEAMTQAVKMATSHEPNSTAQNTFVIVDGSRTIPLDQFLHTERYLRGGLKHYAIAAGSILAKVTRDKHMIEVSKQYPQYDFEKHKGYGTKRHKKLIDDLGLCPLHRRSFRRS